MPSYIVKAAAKKKDVQGKHGPMQVVALTLQEYGQAETCAAEWFTKADTPLPAEGSTIEGDVKPGQYGLDFKKAGGGFSGKGGRSPEESRRITRQHSQDMAIRWAEFAHLRGKLPDEFKLADLIDLTDRFHKDAMEGGQA